MSDHFIIKGVPKTWPSGQAPPTRLEITDLVKIDDQFSLFVQALAKMQGTDWTKSISHFQIGGIHGFPFTPWERSGESPINGNGQGWDGYCTHGSVLFPTWHRPYVALYEQVMQSHAQDIAKGYPDKTRWQNAALALRLPYWDWVEHPVPPPEVIELARVSILMPSGRKEAFPNPFLSYDFKGVEKRFPRVRGELRDWSTIPRTVRYPGYPNPVATFRQRLAATAPNRRNNVEHLLFFVKTWEDFSNHTRSASSTKSSSLEAIHDAIHGLVGAGGHMSDPLVAAFDPIFFLHHCNVDRIFALWQTMNPTVWVSPGSSQGGTWTTQAGTRQDQNSRLTPFWSGPGSNAYWNSQTCRSWEALGYTYPDFANLRTTDTLASQAAITARLQQQASPHKPTPGRFQFPAAVTPPGAEESAPQAAFTARTQAFDENPPASPSTVIIDPAGKHLDPSSGFRDWTARISFKKSELHETIAVHIFLAAPPEDPREWIGAPGFVGSHYAFVNSALDKCSNCVERLDTIDEGYVHLNTAIAKYSKLPTFEEEDVEPYLKSHLHWRVQKADLVHPIATDSIPSLEIKILSAQVYMEPTAQLPTQGKVTQYPEITAGRPGGAAPVS